MVKNKIRKSLFEQGQSISNSSKSSKSYLIQKNVLKKINASEILNIVLYFPFRNEVDTSLLMQAFSELQKNIYMPKVINENEMVFNLLDDRSEFLINKFGIKEIDSERYIDINEIDLMFVPMVGVDPNGYRLGYGSGYFDRVIGALEDYKFKPLLVGLGYQYQICDVYFGEQHDLKYDLIFSDNKMYSYRS